MERIDGARVWASPDLFSEEDQVYIQEWISAQQVLSEKHLRLSFRKMRESVEDEKGPRPDQELNQELGEIFNGEAVHFEITLDNRSIQPIEDLKIEYRYFIQVDNKGLFYRQPGVNGRIISEPPGKLIRRISGHANIDRIQPTSSLTIQTSVVVFGEYRRRIRVTQPGTGKFLGYDELTVVREDLSGIWVRLYGPDVDGQKVFRDVCYPTDLQKKVTWDEQTR